MHLKYFKITGAAILLLLFSFCKEPVLKDDSLLPDEKLGLVFTDTLTLIAHTVREDSLRTDEMPDNLLGKMNDPIFGKSYASVYFQLRLLTNNVDLGSAVQLDSAVLMLRYSGKYGDLTVPQTFMVYEMDESMSRDENYYSNKAFNIKSAEIGRLTNFIPNLDDSIETIEGKLPAHMRIKLDAGWAQNILNQSGGGNLANNENFLQFMKGLYLTVDTQGTGNGMVYLDLFNATSALTFYYRNADRDSLNFKIVTNNSAATLNQFKHNYSGSVVEPFINANSTDGDSVVYIQSMAGLKGKFTAPHIRNLGNISINKAEVLITALKDPLQLDSIYTIPIRLTLNASDADGRNAFIEDQFVSETYFGGVRFQENDSFGNAVSRFKFNTALYYQAVSKNIKTDYGIYMLTFPSTRIGDRLLVGGGNHSQYPLKLKLTYIKID